MKDYEIVSGLECCLISFQNNNTYSIPTLLKSTRSAIVVTNRDIEYVNTMTGRRQIKNKIIDYDLELEVFDIPAEILAKLEGSVIDENGGYVVKNNPIDIKTAIGLVNTYQDDSREFTYYYNCNVEVNTLESETKSGDGTISPKAYKLTIKCLGENRNMKYTVRENNIPSNSNFVENFYKQVYIPR